MQDYGVSPDNNSAVDLLVLGATETGIYPIASQQVTWDPTRVETGTALRAQTPQGFSEAEAEAAPGIPYPITSIVAGVSDSTHKQIILLATNPFTMTVQATITQTIPVNIPLIDNGGGSYQNGKLVWTTTIQPNEAIERRVIFAWDGQPWQVFTLPGAEMAFTDPSSGEGDTYPTDDTVIEAPWPLEVSANVPSPIKNLATNSMQITLKNISESVEASGIFNTWITNTSGDKLWEFSQAIDIQPRGELILTIPFEISTGEDFVIVNGEETIGGVTKEEYLEVIPVSGGMLFLPLVRR